MKITDVFRELSSLRFLCEWRKIMTIAQDLKDAAADVITALRAIDLKLDEVKLKIDSLSAGSVVTQADLDEIAAALAEGKATAAGVLAEASDLALVTPQE